MHVNLGRLAGVAGLVAVGATMAIGALSPKAAAFEDQVAKGLGKGVEWINGPAIDDFEKLRGRVIFVDLWGIN
jgi:hypothetical protein